MFPLVIIIANNISNQTIKIMRKNIIVTLNKKIVRVQT